MLFVCRLQDYCEWLMFHDPQEYGRKAEELLWRKVYYDVIQLMKHNKKVIDCYIVLWKDFQNQANLDGPTLRKSTSNSL